jgi:hypothetical protein
MHSRSLPVTVAAILLALFSVLNLLFPLWANTVQPGEEIPPFIIYLTIVVGIIGLVGAAGLWMLKKWGVWIAIVVGVLNILDAAPGVAFAPTTVGQVAATVTVVAYVLTIVLVLVPTSRRAFAASS